MKKKALFIDRDGTIIQEPADEQIDAFEKLVFVPGTFRALSTIRELTDYEFVITHPEGYELDPKFVGRAKVEYDQRKAFECADFIYAKNWSAYAGDNYGKVLCTDRGWTVDAEKMALTNNAFFMHCLPVRRNMIVTDEVIESPQSLVIPEAANRVVSAQTILKEILTNLY